MEVRYGTIVIGIGIVNHVMVMIMRHVHMGVVMIDERMLVHLPARSRGKQQSQHRERPQHTKPAMAGKHVSATGQYGLHRPSMPHLSRTNNRGYRESPWITTRASQCTGSDDQLCCVVEHPARKAPYVAVP